MALKTTCVSALILAFVLLLLPQKQVPAAQRAAQGGPDAANEESCPLQTRRHTARVLTPRLELQAGEDGFVEMSISPAPGNDFYVSALAKVVQKPQNAGTDILPGFPKLRFRADTQGMYVLELRITLVSKSSCGGVKARELAREEVIVHVQEPAGAGFGSVLKKPVLDFFKSGWRKRGDAGSETTLCDMLRNYSLTFSGSNDKGKVHDVRAQHVLSTLVNVRGFFMPVGTAQSEV